MTVSELMIVSSALVLVVLVALVVALGRQVRGLAREVEQLRSTKEAAAVASPPDRDHLPVAATPPPSPAPDVDRDVRVITDLSDDDIDLTTARIASVTFGGPLIKVAALTHGLRRGLAEEHRMRIAHTFRKELRRQRKVRRRRRFERAGSSGFGP